MSGEFESYVALVAKHAEEVPPEYQAYMKAHKEEMLATVNLPLLASAVYELEERVQQLEIKNQALGTLTHVMLHTLNAVNHHTHQTMDKVTAIEPWLTPVFWICPSPWCGAPQEVPGIVWWMMQTKLLPCKCQVCTWYAVFDEVAHYGTD